MRATCPKCSAPASRDSARYCTKCGTALAHARFRLHALRILFKGIAAALKLLASTGQRRSTTYTWRSRAGTIRASRTSGARRGLPRPQIFKVPGLSRSAKRVYFYLSKVSDTGGNAIPFVRTIASRTGLSKATVAHALAELERGGFLTRTHRYSRRGSGSNLYHLRSLE